MQRTIPTDYIVYMVDPEQMSTIDMEGVAPKNSNAILLCITGYASYLLAVSLLKNAPCVYI
jgi:predicted acetyltransferase